MMCQSWSARATSLFPDRAFCTHFAWYSEEGDPGVVIHQSKWTCRLCKP